MLEPRQPAQAPREVPVPAAEQLHRCGQEHRADDRRVEQHRDRQPDPQLLHVERRERGEDREDRHHHEGCTRHRPCGCADSSLDGLLGRQAAVGELLDPADDEDVVVHRKAEQHGEEEQRQPGNDATVGVEAKRTREMAVLEDPDEDTVGRADREQIEHDRGSCDHERAERQEQQDERQPEHECEDDRRVRARRGVEVHIAGGLARDGRLDAVEPTDGRRHDIVPQQAESTLRGRAVRRADERDVDRLDGVLRIHGRPDRRRHRACGERLRAQPCDGCLHPRRLDVRRLHDDCRGRRRAGERLLHRLVGLHDLQVARQVVEAEELCVHAERRQREHHQEPGRDDRRDRRIAKRRSQDRAPHPRLAACAFQALDERPASSQPCDDARLVPEHATHPGRRDRDDAAVDPVSELREQRRKNCQRADHRAEDDDHRAEPDRREDRRACEQHPGHRDHHRRTRDEHRLAGGRSGPVKCVAVRAACRPLLALTFDVEERVVHSDSHPDQQDHGTRRRRCVCDVADETRDTERSEYGRQREQHGDPGGDERAEGEQQDQEGQGHRQALGLREILADRLVESVVRARIAELRDEEAGMCPLDGGDCVQHGLNAPVGCVGVARQLELHEHRVPILRTHGRLDLLDVAARAQHRRDIRSDRAGRRAGLRLDDHRLACRVVEARVGQDALSRRGLAVRVLRVGQPYCARDRAGDDRGEDECEPSERRRLPVRGTPAARARREIPLHFSSSMRVVGHASRLPRGPKSDNPAARRLRLGLAPGRSGRVSRGERAQPRCATTSGNRPTRQRRRSRQSRATLVEFDAEAAKLGPSQGSGLRAAVSRPVQHPSAREERIGEGSA